MQERVWRLLAAILWLGNVEFEGEEEAVAAAPGDALTNAAALLGVSEPALATALSQRVLSAGAPPLQFMVWKRALCAWRGDHADVSCAASFCLVPCFVSDAARLRPHFSSECSA